MKRKEWNHQPTPLPKRSELNIFCIAPKEYSFTIEEGWQEEKSLYWTRDLYDVLTSFEICLYSYSNCFICILVINCDDLVIIFNQKNGELQERQYPNEQNYIQNIAARYITPGVSLVYKSVRRVFPIIKVDV
jgi:hypothetical protein